MKNAPKKIANHRIIHVKFPKNFSLPPHDEGKISRRSARMAKAISRASPSLQGLQEAEKNEIRRLSLDGVDIRGVLGEHDVDERIAELHAGSPWLRDASTHVWQETRARAADGFHLRPTLLVGPPWCGKTHYLQRLAGIFGVPSMRVDASIEGHMILGLERGWGSARPSEIVRLMMRERCANPLVIVDEIDKSDSYASTKVGRAPGLTEKLLSIIEPEAAVRWRDPYFGLEFDMSRVTFVFTANRLDDIPLPLLSRVRVIRCGPPPVGDLTSRARRTMGVP